MARETIDQVLDGAARTPARRPRPHRRRAGAEPALPPPRPRGPRAGRPRHRPLQPHGPERAGARGPGRVPRRRGGRGHRVAAVLLEGERRPPARRRRVRVVDPGPAQTQRAGLRAAWIGAGPEPRLQPAGPVAAAGAGAAGGDLQARAGRALRHRLQSALHAGQHADRPLRLDAGVAGQVRAVHGAAALGAQPGQSRRRDVPHAGVGRLARLPARLRFQPDARASRCW